LCHSRLVSAPEIILVGAAVLVGYFGLCLLVRRFGRSMVWWCLPIALLLTATYAFALRDIWAGTLYSSISSDQATNLSYTQNVIHGNYLGDLYGKRTPAQYPPLYFWCLGLIARVVGVSALAVWRYSPLLLFLLLPFLAYFVGEQVGDGEKRCGFYACFALFALAAYQSAHFVGVNPSEFDPFVLMSYFLAKPYQIIGGLLLVLWLVRFARGPRSGKVSAGWLLANALLAASVFLLYSPWFGVGFAALALEALLGVRWTGRGAYLGWHAVVGAATAVLTAVHWLPYVLALGADGHENTAGTAHFLSGHMDPSWVTTGMGFFGLSFFLAVLGLAQRFAEPGARALALAIGVTYAWYFSTYVTFPLFGFSFLPHRCHSLLTVLLAAGACLGIERVRGMAAALGRPHVVAPIVLAAIAGVLAPSYLRWNIRTDPMLARGAMRLSIEERRMAAAFHGAHRTLAGCLGSEVLQIASLTYTRLYLSPNLPQGNPLTHYRRRVAELQAAAEAHTGAELAAALRDLDVDAVLLKKPLEGPYYLDYWLRPSDALDSADVQDRVRLVSLIPAIFFPEEAQRAEDPTGKITFARELLEEPYFEKAVETEWRVLFLRKQGPVLQRAR
jgi:hypothetical protein